MFVVLAIVAVIAAMAAEPPALPRSRHHANKIKVASDAAYPPFEMVDEATKELVGFDIDLFKAIAKKAESGS